MICVRHTPVMHGMLFGMRDKTRHQAWLAMKRANKPVGVCSRYPECADTTDGVHKLCAKHLARARANKAANKTKPKAPGECRIPECRNPARPGFSRCERCTSRGAKESLKPACKKRRAERRQEIKHEVLTSYGAVCQCCRNTDMAFLTMDHIDRYNGEGPRRGTPLYLWLKRQDYPAGFRVLCMNCNFSLGKFGYCPHSDLVQPFRERPVLAATLRTREGQRSRNFRLKLAAFEAYGGAVCACCGESHHEHLSIDHIANNGAAHRKELAGTTLYWWLSQHHYPPGFQVLCMNCNCSKRDHGVCQHTRQGGVA